VNDLARRSFLAGSLGVGAAMALAACADRSDPGTGPGGGKTNLVVAVSALAPSLNGVLDGNGLTLQAFEMNANLQAGLVRNPYLANAKTPGSVVQNFNTYTGYVAESYEVSADGLKYTFHLRKNLKGPLGNPITADDVIYSFKRKWSVPTYATASWGDFKGPDAITKVDDHTVTFEIPSAGFGLTFLGLLANLQGHIYDSALLKKHATKDDPWTLKWSANNGGWGLGPYYMSSQTPDQEMILAANPNYAYGAPPIKKVTLRVVTDAGTRASLVVSGAADMAEDILPTDQAKLKSNKSVVVPEVANPIAYPDLTLVTNKAPFNDVKVRQAFAYAVPYTQIMKQIYAGRAVPMKGNINPGMKNYSTASLPTPTYDAKKAKSLLAAAGHPDGLAFTLSVSTATADLVNACSLIKSYAADAGFDITIEQMPAAEFGTARTNATKQAIIYLNRSQVQTPTYACITFFKPHDDPSSPSRWEDALNKKFWTYVDKADALKDTLSPEGGRLWAEAQKVQIDAAAEIFVCGIQPTQIYRKNVSGFAYRSENAIDFGNVKISSE